MSDLKKCRLGNLSNEGKLLCKRVLLDEDPIQRPEDSMDYIQDPVFQNGPQFSDGCDTCKLVCKARVEQSRIPKALASGLCLE
jgi:hypothetical protein